MNSNNIPIILVCKEKQKIYNVEVESDVKLEELVMQFQELIQPGNQQQIVLYFNEMILNPKKQLKDYDIVKGSTIEIRITTLGGI